MAKKVVKKPVSIRKPSASPAKGTSGKTPDFLTATRSLGKKWNEAKKQEPRRGGGGSIGPNENVPDDDYLTRLLSASVGVTKTGSPFFRTTYTIFAGKTSGNNLEGETIGQTDWISDQPLGDSGRTQLSILSDRLQLLGYDLSDYDLSDLPTIAKELSESQPACKVRVVNKYKPGENGQTKLYQSVYVNELIEESAFDSTLESLIG
jgi:hypothetical protein